MHEETMVKVNIPVDRKVAPLVEALSAIPEVVTAISCEGDEGGDWAYVGFHYKDAESQLELSERLSKAIGSDPRMSDEPFKVSMEWYAGGETALCYLRVPHQHIETVAEIISAAVDDGALAYDLVP
jgi:hypothetical protein